ncbi:MAG: GerMN domain-containing protein [Candidatus Colwellbacteria bacterium]|nr:GerMN domain-containing protein [Candidatus Colwellbacteria bacterium]
MKFSARLAIVLAAGLTLTAVYWAWKSASALPRSISVNIYFANERLGTGDVCAEVFPVARRASPKDDLVRRSVELLLQGPTLEERGIGYETSINPGVSIRQIDFRDGVFYADFDQEIEREVGGSCRVSSIRKQIGETLKQFAGVEDAVVSVEGRVEDALQP